jgi:hypothetical protein
MRLLKAALPCTMYIRYHSEQHGMKSSPQLSLGHGPPPREACQSSKLPSPTPTHVKPSAGTCHKNVTTPHQPTAITTSTLED